MIKETQREYETALADLARTAKAAPEVGELATFEEVVDFAIHESTKAYVSYMTLAGQAEYPWTRKTFDAFAAEDVVFIDRLVEMKKAGRPSITPQNVTDPRLDAYLTADALPRRDMDTREAYVLAIREKEAAAGLYRDLAEKAVVPETQEFLLALAQEEAKHKVKLETEYEDHALGQN